MDPQNSIPMKGQPMKPTRIELAKQMALEVGEFALLESQKTHDIHFKDSLSSDPVTDVDRSCEKMIVDAIKKHYPDDGIIGEEGGPYNSNTTNYWVIDPLDGTQNYMHRLPLYCVSICYVEHTKPQIGVIYAPFFKELYVAERGKGTTLNNLPIKVSDEIQDFSRHFGTSALSLAWVACGRLSYYKAHELFPWDFAAGALIVEEAGGIACTLENTPLAFFLPQSIFASNKKLKNKHFEGMK
jgi:myo-inositol-1(or 4)-monophosphatase